MNLLKDNREKDWFWLENETVDRADLTIYEKMTYIVLARHTNSESTCFPSYNTIAQKAGCSRRKVMDCINSLEKKKLIKKDIRKSKGNFSSNIYQVMSIKTVEVVNDIHQNGESCALGVVNSMHPNNTNNNNTNITTYSLVINRLNEVCNKNYKSSTPKTKKLIQARLNENFVLEDFYKVIDLKSKEWLGTEMEKYLRPETLFGNKFEGYLNEKVSTKNEIENVDDGFIPELQFETLK